MKPDDLKKIIRSIIQEELKKQLPALIPQVLTEILNGKKQVISSKPVKSQPINKPPVKKEFKKYSNNPVLNDILNETVNKIVPEDNYVGFTDRPRMSASTVTINDGEEEEMVSYSDIEESESSIPVVADIIPADETQAKVLGKINRDFRGLMKAVEAKRNMSGGLPPTNVEY